MLSSRQKEKLSKHMTWVLRHRPEKAGVDVDDSGWAKVDDLVCSLHSIQRNASRSDVFLIVATCEKRRYELSDDGSMIRAVQGHSFGVDLGLQPVEPPEFLYHGTNTGALSSIQVHGIQKGQRHHVHLSTDVETAQSVGARRGSSVVLKVNAAQMHQDGFEFMCAQNGVWLTDIVPNKYIAWREAEYERAC